ncbi:MAG TPA: YtxH domain-containing protein [Candidatus Saccharimonadales bacterium]|jgi:gas vesicle protein|nr:YtxH domain-containing protein [Candidatus Saccharimonadales bacterium]
MKNAPKKFAVAAVVAAAAGYIAGILTAPKSGKETRTDIKEAAEHGVAEAEKQLKKLHTELNTVISEAKTKGSELKGKAQEELEKATTAAQAVKEKARELLSAVHEGHADDKDLKKAISEAAKAVDHLRSFLKKV